MSGALLDTHVLYWLATAADRLSEEALVAITVNQSAGRLYVSPITAWELAIASRKPMHKDPPDLGVKSPSTWFSRAVASASARIIPIGYRIACEAAAVALDTGHRDPEDCYLIATARRKKIPIITRDRAIHDIAHSGYVAAIAC